MIGRRSAISSTGRPARPGPKAPRSRIGSARVSVIPSGYT